MTDAYENGTEPPDHEAGQDEHLTKGEAAHDYEFADEHGAVADENSEEHSPLPSADTKSPRPLLPIAAAVGGVLLLGVVAWWQFGRAPAPQFASSDMPVVAPAMHEPVAAPQSTAPAPVTVLPTAPKTAAASVSIPVPVAADMAQALPAASAAAPAAVSSSVPSLSAPPSSAPALAAPAEGTAAAPAAAGANADPRIQTLSARIDSLQKDLDQANAQLSQLNTMVTAAATAGGAPKEMQQQLDKIEQQLAQLHQMSVSASLPAIAAGEPLPFGHKIAAAHHARAAKPKKKIASATKPSPAAHWVLRAATPGQAWVAANDSTTDLKELAVGDRLAGIGKVTAIEHQGDSWVVRGTQGTIR